MTRWEIDVPTPVRSQAKQGAIQPLEGARGVRAGPSSYGLRAHPQCG